MEEESYLCFIRLVGEENDGYYRYEFIFTNDVENVWGEDFDERPACLVNNLMIDDEFVGEIHIVKTKIKLDLIQDNCCFSMADCYDSVVSLAWENLDDLDEYPSDGRIFFRFGETFSEVENKLALKNVLML